MCLRCFLTTKSFNLEKSHHLVSRNQSDQEQQLLSVDLTSFDIYLTTTLLNVSMQYLVYNWFPYNFGWKSIHFICCAVSYNSFVGKHFIVHTVKGWHRNHVKADFEN